MSFALLTGAFIVLQAMYKGRKAERAMEEMEEKEVFENA